MTVGIVHDYLSQRGGAERVVLRLAVDTFPGAEVFTSFYRPQETFAEMGALSVHTTRLDSTVDAAHFRRKVLRYPAAFRSMDLSQLDVAVISSSAFAHHARHPVSIVYCHTPPRFLYEPASYRGISVASRLAWPALEVLRSRDRRAARSHSLYIANSALTASRVADLYGISAPVVHPPLHTAHLPARSTGPRPATAIVVSRLLPYKRIDLAVVSCGLAGVPLTVVGTGPDEARLRHLATSAPGPGVRFLGRITDEQLSEELGSHGVLLAPGMEDFGFAPLEANYAGMPAVALAAGGALETVDAPLTGELVDGTSVDAWARAIDRALSTDYDPAALRCHAMRFSGEEFDTRLRSTIKEHLGFCP